MAHQFKSLGKKQVKILFSIKIVLVFYNKMNLTWCLNCSQLKSCVKTVC